MLKVLDAQIGMIEVPNEISLIFGISNCPYRCEHCHTPKLQEDVGTPLSLILDYEIYRNIGGITCVCFFGGDSNLDDLIQASKDIKHKFKLKTAVYLGVDKVPPKLIPHFDYIKIGQYNHILGGLSSSNTNQVMYQIENYDLVDITTKFKNKY